MDRNLRDLERFQDPLRLKLLQRRLGQGVYIQEYPRPIQVFRDTELLIDISKNEDGYRSGSGSGFGGGFGGGWGSGDGYGGGWGSGDGGRDGDGYGLRHRFGEAIGSGSGYGSGAGSESGESEYYYTENLREKIND